MKSHREEFEDPDLVKRLCKEAKENLSLVDYLEKQLGVNAKKSGLRHRFSSCPSCGESSSSSVKLCVEEDERSWQCFSCGENGSIIDAAMLFWNCSVLEAAQGLLGKKSDLKRCTVPKRDSAVVDAEKAAKTERMKKAFCIIQDVCLSFSEEADVLNYLVHERKVPLSIVREAQKRGMVGFLPVDPNLARKVLIDAVGQDLLRETGLWKPETALPGISYRPLVFFMPGLSSAEFRHIGDTSGNWTKSIRYGSLEKPYFWEGDHAQCVIVEGMIDLLSAVALGYTGHTMGIPGCNTFNPSWFPVCAKRYALERYVVTLDNDPEKIDAKIPNPGQHWAKKIVDQIKSQGIPCINKVLPKGDLNDLLRSKAS